MANTEKRLAADFGARMRRAREAKGYSLDRLALLVGLDKGNLSKIERGRRKSVNFALLERLTSALGVPTEDLLGLPRQ